MGRGRKPRSSTVSTVVQTVQTATSQTQGFEAGGSKQTTQQKNCWEFELQNITSVGRNAAKGTPVQGVRDSSLVAVLSDDGALGYAPASKSASMLKAIEDSGSLVGEVLNNQNNSRITIQLCLM